MTQALLIIDLQVGIFAGRGGMRQAEADRRLAGLESRLSTFANAWSRSGRPVILVQHDGPLGHRLERGTPGWALAPGLRRIGSIIVHKTECDSFFGTELRRRLEHLSATTVVVGGCMTEYCVDTTCRAALSQGFDVILIGDGHETVDGDLSAAEIVRHHNGLLDGMTAGDRSCTVLSLASLSAGLARSKA